MVPLEWIFVPQWKLIGSYRNIANDSNFDVAAYHKEATELALQYNY